MISPLANVHPEAKIGQNVTIEPFATIEKDVVIGDGSWIGAYASIQNGARIGKKCRIFQSAMISCLPQDLKYKGEETTTVIGDNTIVREFVTISRGTSDRYKTSIGKNCLIMSYVHVAHDCIVGDHVILVNTVQLAGHVIVDDWAIISGGSVVHQFTKIGKHVMIMGGSLVGKDIPPYVKAGRLPISYAGVNSVGLRRRGFSNDKINEIQEIYRILYLRGHNNSVALDKIELELSPSEERDEVLNFVRNSGRGIMKGYQQMR